jgi:two-component system LytT family response regulator
VAHEKLGLKACTEGDGRNGYVAFQLLMHPCTRLLFKEIMKIESIIIDKERSSTFLLKKCLHSNFPEISINGEGSDYFEATRLIKTVHPKLIFSGIDIISRLKNASILEHFEFVCLSDHTEDAISAIRQNACGFILKPINVHDVVISVASVIRKLNERPLLKPDNISFASDTPALPHTKLIGIPTMEGIEFLYAHEIVRCEGLQKCTRIVSTRKNNMVSAHNIGEFRKMLEGYGFFSCHKSHLINLMHVNKYTREGFVFLIDNTAVPLARRKRLEFLQNLKHL